MPGPVLTVWIGAILTAAITASIPMLMLQIAAGAVLVMIHPPIEVVDRSRRVGPVLGAVVIAALLGVVTLWRVSAPALPVEWGLHRGWAQVVSEPRPSLRGVRVVLAIDGARYEAFPSDPTLLAEIAAWQGGHQVFLLGEKSPLSDRRADRVAWQHVRGTYRIDAIRARAEGNRLSILSNRFRASIARGAQVLGPNDAAVFRGLVIGDRSGQTPEMQQRYALSGLSHLTVVSGLNLSLLMIAISPVLSRARPMFRWIMTLVLLAWFVSMTRYEPSIMRAAAMAALTATATLRGDDRGVWRVLWVAVGLLVLHDPALVGSVGFWLSVGATAGVAVLGPRLAQGLSPCGPLAQPLGVSLGAQLGVAPPMLMLMGGVPVWSVPANLLAVPVASAVKVYGLPAAALAGAVPWLAEPLMFPVRMAVRWVDLVARFFAGVETAPWMDPAGHLRSWVVGGAWALWIGLSLAALIAWARGVTHAAGEESRR